MDTQQGKRLVRAYRISLVCFMGGLVLSGVTAFPLLWEMETLTRLLGIAPDTDPQTLSGMAQWLVFVHQGLRHTYREYPFLAYGTDWLGFAHIVIAVFFIGPLREPTRYPWTLVSGMIACVLVLPLALICGPLRGIPLFWILIDCTFGIVGVLPLAYCFYLSRQLAAMEREGCLQTAGKVVVS